MYNLLIATTSCKKYLSTRVNAIKNSWNYNGIYKNFKITHLFFIGGNDEKQENDLITLKCRDDYCSLSGKTYSVLKYINDNLHFDYLIKTNDDSYVNIEKFCDSNFENYDYGGYCCINTDMDVLQQTDFAQGGFYFLSCKSTEYILNTEGELSLLNNLNSSIEDQNIGRIMAQKNNLKFLKLNNFPKIDMPFHICEEGMSIHPVHHTLMRELYTNKNHFNKQLSILKYKSFTSDYGIRRTIKK